MPKELFSSSHHSFSVQVFLYQERNILLDCLLNLLLGSGILVMKDNRFD